MLQLLLDFQQAPAASSESSMAVSNDVIEKVTHRFNITANVLEFLVSQGLFFEDDFDWESAAEEWVRLHKEDVKDFDNENPYWHEVSCAYERLQEAIEQADQDNHRIQTAEMYCENVYYYYGINSNCRKERPLPFSDFMRACNGLATRYNNPMINYKY